MLNIFAESNFRLQDLSHQSECLEFSLTYSFFGVFSWGFLYVFLCVCVFAFFFCFVRLLFCLCFFFVFFFWGGGRGGDAVVLGAMTY